MAQNQGAEQKSQAAFESLQTQILNVYGLHAPTTPVLRLRNATQTSLVLEWDPVQLATSTLRSLALYRNGNKAGNIPRPLDMSSTKISGLQPDTEYSFHLVLRTSGGTYTSNTLAVKTHSMTNLTGITITPGVLPASLRESLETAVERIGARIADTVRIDTTHFVCTEGRGREWEKANEMNIPIVRPEWVEGCEREGKIIGVRGYYLDANPKHRQIGSNPSLPPGQGAQPSPASVMSPASEVAVQASQVDLPSRPQPKSPDRESSVSGEPGPEVEPSPTLNEHPAPPSHDGDEESDEQEDESEKQAEAGEAQNTAGESDEGESEEGDEEDSTEPGLKTKARGGGDMEEVAL